MDLRTVNIGTRLGAGFGVILLATAAMIGWQMLSSSAQRNQVLQSLQVSEERVAAGSAMQLALLGSAVAVRNMGLQTEVAAVQQDEAIARKKSAEYGEIRQRLAESGLSDEEAAPLKKLAAIDQQMQAQIKQAVDLLATFNTDQAATVITAKIDPLQNEANTELARFIALEKQRATAAMLATDGQVQRSQWVTLTIGALVIALSALLAWRLTASITAPLQEAEHAATRMADGDLGFDVQAHGRDEAARLLLAMRHMRAKLAGLVAEVRQNAESVAGASSEIAQGNSDLSSRTEQQASALQETASSMEELGTAVRQNADSARQANQLAMGAADVAARGGEVVGRVVTTMKGINESSRRIADIIGVIDGIAFQTNILALNAAVEAARAGEQGRGFAVVASEVRSLASRSADAAKEIKQLIATSVERVDAGSQLVDTAGSTMTEVVASIRRVTDIVGEISVASNEQSSGVAQVGLAITQMDQTTQQNAALVEQSAAAAESLRGQADQLVQAVSVFRLGSTAAERV
jgi:methyl-accepting chemotaxis protein